MFGYTMKITYSHFYFFFLTFDDQNPSESFFQSFYFLFCILMIEYITNKINKSWHIVGKFAHKIFQLLPCILNWKFSYMCYAFMSFLYQYN
jgi:hypothetical protein